MALILMTRPRRRRNVPPLLEFTDSLQHYLTCSRLWKAINTASRGPAYVANILNLPNAKFEIGWRSAHTDVIRPMTDFQVDTTDHETRSPPVHIATLASNRLCVRNASALSCSRITVAALTYHALKHQRGLNKRSTLSIASTTIKVAAAALEKGKQRFA